MFIYKDALNSLENEKGGIKEGHKEEHTFDTYWL